MGSGVALEKSGLPGGLVRFGVAADEAKAVRCGLGWRSTASRTSLPLPPYCLAWTSFWQRNKPVSVEHK